MHAVYIALLALIPTPGQAPGGLDVGRANPIVPLPTYIKPPEPPIIALYLRPAQAAAGRILMSFIRPGMTFDQVKKILGSIDRGYGGIGGFSCRYGHLCIWVRYDDDNMVKSVSHFVPRIAK